MLYYKIIAHLDSASSRSQVIISLKIEANTKAKPFHVEDSHLQGHTKLQSLPLRQDCTGRVWALKSRATLGVGPVGPRGFSC